VGPLASRQPRGGHRHRRLGLAAQLASGNPTMSFFTGQARASLSFLGSGFLLGIPVFFDTVFYLLVPLAKAMRLRTGRDYLLYILAIVAGGTMTHSLVPPTPGPLFVAYALGVSVGDMIVVGFSVGILTAGAGYVWAHVANQR
jgi:GntP family gluconate:H+ symporter